MKYLRASSILFFATIIAMPAMAADTTFEAQIAPILRDNCLPCHGPGEPKAELRLDTLEGLAAGSAFGPVILPGDSGSSILIHNVERRDGAKPMPPKGPPLSEEAIKILRTWIDSNPKLPESAKKANASREHWAYQPLTKPEVPDVAASDRVRNSIDAFILAKLEREGLTPSPETDKRTLIRRVTFDLTGLPPTPAEVDAFLNDESPGAYEKVVDRLLASPRYGERWGRHWLDVAHFAETHGFDKDQRRDNAWPYRDYVIESLNEDKPYARFIEEQIAGDVLYPGDPEATVATGFVAAGPWDLVGQIEVREGTMEKKRVRTLDRDDMVATVFGTFQSATVHCARCHDHKFDPISQTEYYSLQSIFAGVDRGDRAYEDPATAEYRALLTRERDALQNAVNKFKEEMAANGGDVLAPYDDEIARLKKHIEAVKDPKKATSPSNGWHSTISQARDEEHWVQIDLGEPVSIDTVTLIPARPTDYKDTPGFGFPLRYTVALSNDPEFNKKHIIADYTGADFTNPGDSPVVLEAEGAAYRYVRVHATHLWERNKDFVFALAEMQVNIENRNIAAGKNVTASSSIEFGRWAARYLVDGYNSRTPVLLDAELGENKLATLEEKLALHERQRLSAYARDVDGVLAAKLNEAERELAGLNKKINALPPPKKVYAAKPVEPRPVFNLRRGDVAQPGGRVWPQALAYMDHYDAELCGVDRDDEGSARAALAKWLTSPENALTWRSIVNRVWHYHFGRGIVRTPNDFGRMGADPTHPELLDWLAAEFRDNGASLKSLHKSIVTSATYRQTSANNPQNAKKDASNRYLWRMNRQKLEAEAVRDAMLAISGKLDLTMGGPSMELFNYTHDHSPKYDYVEMDKPEAWRRSIYRFIVRSVPDPFFDALDCADPNVNVPVRNETLTALQALALLNDPFVINQAKYTAQELAKQAETLEDQIVLAYERCFARPPTHKELDLMTNYAIEHGMPNTIRLLFNANEFLFID